MNDDPSLWVTINGEHVSEASPMKTGCDGIALSCDGDKLFFTPLTSRTMYGIETEVLRNFDYSDDDYDSKVAELGYKSSAADGLSASSKGIVYMTSIELNGILTYDKNSLDPEDFNYKEFEVAAMNDTTMMWPDTIGWDDNNKRLVFVSNQLHHFTGGTINFENPKYGDYNYRIWAVEVDDKSYINGCHDDSSSSDDDSFPIWAIIVICLVVVIIVSVGVGIFLYKRRNSEQTKEPASNSSLGSQPYQEMSTN